MSFFGISRFRNDDHEQRKLENENKRLQEEIEMSRYRERRDDYDREQQLRCEAERRRCNEAEERENRRHRIDVIHGLQVELDDLKLRHRFGVEEDENK